MHVTHDREEALVMADRIFIMESGRIAQQGSPEEVFTAKPRCLIGMVAHSTPKAFAKFLGFATGRCLRNAKNAEAVFGTILGQKAILRKTKPSCRGSR